MSAARIDHVVYAVRDLDAAGQRFLAEFGLASVPGGRHVDFGTGNRIVPVGSSQYVELIGIVDADLAASNPLGQRLLQQVAERDRLIGWALSTPDIEGAAARLGLPVTRGSRTRHDGVTLRWRSAGLEAAMAEECLPFFLSWEVPEDQHPGRSEAAHRVRPRGISRIEVSGKLDRIERWLGGEELPVAMVEGTPALTSVTIAADDGDIVLA
jgi:hypothetical protein